MAKTAPAPQNLPLFYKNPVPLDRKLHGAMSLAQGLDFSFAAKARAVPVTLAELPQAALHYPIGFSTAAPLTPLAIVGVRDNQNLFVDTKGNWVADTYIPAYVRRYPFIFARNPEGDRMALCIDDANRMLLKNTKNPLFAPDGALAQAGQTALEFCKSYQAAAEETEAFSAALAAAGVFAERNASMTFRDGAKAQLSGFAVIDEDKFYALPQDTVAAWHGRRWLQGAEAQLLSTPNWQKLFRMAEERPA
jgi:SapC